MHALFDKNLANNKWSIQSALLKEYIEYFGPKTEQLDIYAEDSRAIFTSYTEKIMNGKGCALSYILANHANINQRY